MDSTSGSVENGELVYVSEQYKPMVLKVWVARRVTRRLTGLKLMYMTRLLGWVLNSLARDDESTTCVIIVAVAAEKKTCPNGRLLRRTCEAIGRWPSDNNAVPAYSTSMCESIKRKYEKSVLASGSVRIDKKYTGREFTTRSWWCSAMRSSVVRGVSNEM